MERKKKVKEQPLEKHTEVTTTLQLPDKINTVKFPQVG